MCLEWEPAQFVATIWLVGSNMYKLLDLALNFLLDLDSNSLLGSDSNSLLDLNLNSLLDLYSKF